MEYKKYLTKNLVALQDNLIVSKTLLDHCVAKKIFHKSDKNRIWSDPDESNRSSEFWNLAMTRKCLSYLIDIFGELEQQPIVEILIRAERDDGSDSKYNFIKNLKKLDVKLTRPDEAITHQDDEYRLDKNIIGLALIINVIYYDNPKNRRHGAIHDSEYMRDLWKQLGYQIRMPRGTRFTDEDIRRNVNLAVQDLTKYTHLQSLVVFIGAHGEDGKLVMSDGSDINLYDDVVFKFDISCLDGKPKLFFVQACQYFPTSGNSLTKHIYDTLESMEDTVVCFSTLPGQPANRDIFLGSYYIYTLADVFMKEAYRTELQEMLNQVQNKLVTEFKQTNKQISYHLPYNMKKLYFNVQPDK